MTSGWEEWRQQSQDQPSSNTVAQTEDLFLNSALFLNYNWIQENPRLLSLEGWKQGTQRQGTDKKRHFHKIFINISIPSNYSGASCTGLTGSWFKLSGWVILTATRNHPSLVIILCCRQCAPLLQLSIKTNHKNTFAVSFHFNRGATSI